MTAETWKRVEQILGEALELPPAGRDAFAAAQCAGDPALHAQVQALLDADSKAGDYLESSPVDFLREQYAQYRAVREIGRGGMSVVYLGERLGGEFERKVAIKILLDAAGPLGREETRILAALEHPSIARLYDAGATANGFRYLVMEYVDGAPIAEWACGLNREQKLRLFLQVCAGVQYAHRSLVVHRDLKPANILVTKDGVAKLLDFGIARMLSSTPAGDHTTGAAAWTPDYASPEQIQGLPVTTATDVYSLGVVLCELLTGRRPRNFGHASLQEMVDAARHREVTPPPGLDDDLERIAGKALRRDPQERYESVAALAADIERSLAGKPIEARPYSRWYALRRFIARHRLSVAAGAAALALLVATAAVALVQARLAGQRFTQVRGLARTMLFELYDSIAAQPGTLPARQLLAQRGLEYLDALAQTRGSDTALQLELAQGYVRLGGIEGGMGGPNLGRTAATLERYDKARTLLEEALRREPHHPAVRAQLVDVLGLTASALTARSRPAEGIPYAERAVRLAEEDRAAQTLDAAADERYAKALRFLGIALQNRKGGKDESIPIWEKLIALHTRMLERDPQSPLRQRDLAMAHRMMAFSLSLGGDFRGTARHTQQAYAWNQRRLAAGDKTARPDVAYDLGALAVAARRVDNNYAQAVVYLEQQLALRRELFAAEPGNAQMKGGIVYTLSSLSGDYTKLGLHREAIAAGEESVRLARALLAADPGYGHGTTALFEGLANLSYAYKGAGQQGKACAATREARKLLDGPLGKVRVDPEQSQQVRSFAAACGN